MGPKILPNIDEFVGGNIILDETSIRLQTPIKATIEKNGIIGYHSCIQSIQLSHHLLIALVDFNRGFFFFFWGFKIIGKYKYYEERTKVTILSRCYHSSTCLLGNNNKSRGGYRFSRY